MDAALAALVPAIVPGHTFVTHIHQGKPDLLKKLESRLRGYSRLRWPNLRLVVLLDRDQQDCIELKTRLTDTCSAAGADALCRIAVEELEAWFFGDVEALRSAYPEVPRNLANRAPFRDPDAIAGGTAEALARVLRQAGYYRAGMPKVEVARRVAAHMDPGRNRSRSFQVFVSGLQHHVQ